MRVIVLYSTSSAIQYYNPQIFRIIRGPDADHNPRTPTRSFHATSDLFSVIPPRGSVRVQEYGLVRVIVLL